jgi:pimeloyl-ACP methyl ester carboxylesterase
MHHMRDVSGTGGLPDEPYPANHSEAIVRELVVAGERVRVVESGVAGAFPVVLLHGWAASAYNFRKLLGPLGQSGFHAIAPDLRGHGWSETTVPRGGWSAAAMADWVRRLLDSLGVGRCVLVGQSIGGAVALDAAGIMPERMAGLVLLAPVGFTPVRRVILARAVPWWQPASTPRWTVSLILRRIYGRRAMWTERDLNEYWTPLRRQDVLTAILQSAREFDFTPRDPGSRPLGDIRMFIRFGELDRLIPHREAVVQARRFPGADVAVFEDVGHVPAEEVPEEVIELIRRAAR